MHRDRRAYVSGLRLSDRMREIIDAGGLIEVRRRGV
jgi:hypothetical protein